jgi:hypothetical protein
MAVATAPINSIPAVAVSAPPSPWPTVMPIPVVTGNVPMPPQAPVQPQAVVVVTGPYAPIAPVPMIMLAGGTPTGPGQPIPVVVVG